MEWCTQSISNPQFRSFKVSLLASQMEGKGREGKDALYQWAGQQRCRLHGAIAWSEASCFPKALSLRLHFISQMWQQHFGGKKGMTRGEKATFALTCSRNTIPPWGKEATYASACCYVWSCNGWVGGQSLSPGLMQGSWHYLFLSVSLMKNLWCYKNQNT